MSCSPKGGFVYNAGMDEIYQLPIPDWGLRCPHCRTLLAGMHGYFCDNCRKGFDILHLLAEHKPIAPVGLTCPFCEYSLTGLTLNRCPECGHPFSVRVMLEKRVRWARDPSGGIIEYDHHLKKREPSFTGRERPLPDFGLICTSCGAPLAGAEDDRCPACNQPFDIHNIGQQDDWVDISPYVSPRMVPVVRTVLYDAKVPYVVDDASLHRLYGGLVSIGSAAIRVPREFILDALYALSFAAKPPSLYVDQAWSCPNCGQQVPAGFEICWNCNAACPDLGDAET